MMAAEPSPKLHQFKHSDSQFDSQLSTLLEQNFLAPLADSQETQDVVSQWHDDIGGQQENATNQPLQSTTGPFFSRPLPVDPLDFQNGFQYSKAPTPKIRPNRPNAPQNGLGLQIDSKNDSPVKTEHPHHDPGCLTVDDPSDDSRNVPGVGAQASRSELNTRINTYVAVSIHSDHSSDGTLATHGQLERGTLKDLLPKPPFQNTSPFNKASASFQQPKANVQSPATRLEGPRLPKAFADIQRKALIQSNRANHSSHSVRHSKSQAGKASSSRFNTPEVHQDLTNDHEAIHTRTRKPRERPTEHPTFNRSTHTPRKQAIDGKPRENRSTAVETARPFTEDVHTDYSMTRPMSGASNISKLRTPLGKERTHARARRAIPDMDKSNALRHRLSQSWNQFFVHEARRNEHWEEKMNDMVEQLAERDNKVSEYLEEIQRRGQVIEDLEHVNKEQDALYQEKEAALTELTEQRQKVREKMRQYRDRLNDVTKEQQSIFLHFQPRFHLMKEQMKRTELDYQSSLEQAISTTNVVRDKMKQRVKEVQTLSEQEIQKLRLEIRTLEVKLAEREKDVNREKEHMSDLRRELNESHELNRDAFKSLDTQNQELMKKSDEETIHIRNVEHCVNQQEQRIQSLQKFLEDDKANAPSPSELAENFKVLQTETLNCVLSELRENAVSDREQSSQAAEGLKSDILAVGEVCISFGKQIQSSQNASEWQEKFGKAQMDHQALLRQTDRLKEKLAKMQDEAKMQLGQHESLQQELNSLRASAKATDESNGLIEILQKENERIQGSLDEKEICIRGLEDELRGIHEALSAQNCRLEDNERQIQDEQEKLTQAVASCHEQQDQAVKQARAEECARTRAEYCNIENRLHEAEQGCDRLQNELVQVKQNAEIALKNSKDEAVRQAQEVLEPIVGLMDKVTEGLQTAKHTKDDLKEKLEAWSNGHVELSLLRQAVRKIEKGQTKAIENGNLLGELLDVEKKLEATWQWHNSEVDALNRAIDLEKSVKADMERFNRQGHKGKQVPGIPHAVNRRVMVKSPGTDDDHNKMVPISNEEERATRRQIASLRGIMKSAVLQVERRPEEQHHKAFSRSAYNRPVLGSSARVEEEPVNEAMPENMETGSTEMSARKRKRADTEANLGENADEKLQLAEKRRAKISHSLSSDFHDPISKKPATDSIRLQAQLFYSKSEPIERRPRPFMTYGSPDLDIRGRVVSSTMTTLPEDRGSRR
ncbi:hypothetical protein E0Z10_g192 [Xylaria hypoxylon]|uniref:Uncharacterized protein n=1 Tax=Xylaria hypoxylon TaxID=37992 RepID=A0A4Z0ZBW3_9PEZI|nr:hypothetical protein E0Z10_g192 [Xylaria hypoxylon]